MPTRREKPGQTLLPLSSSVFHLQIWILTGMESVANLPCEGCSECGTPFTRWVFFMAGSRSFESMCSLFSPIMLLLITLDRQRYMLSIEGIVVGRALWRLAHPELKTSWPLLFIIAKMVRRPTLLCSDYHDPGNDTDNAVFKALHLSYSCRILTRIFRLVTATRTIQFKSLCLGKGMWRGHCDTSGADTTLVHHQAHHCAQRHPWQSPQSSSLALSRTRAALQVSQWRRPCITYYCYWEEQRPWKPLEYEWNSQFTHFQVNGRSEFHILFHSAWGPNKLCETSAKFAVSIH